MSDCNHVITYKADMDSQMIDFEVYVKDAPAFLAVGFSNDTKMVCDYC